MSDDDKDKTPPHQVGFFISPKLFSYLLYPLYTKKKFHKIGVFIIKQ
jgi:hypothetical protein